VYTLSAGIAILEKYVWCVNPYTAYMRNVSWHLWVIDTPHTTDICSKGATCTAHMITDHLQRTIKSYMAYACVLICFELYYYNSVVHVSQERCITGYFHLRAWSFENTHKVYCPVIKKKWHVLVLCVVWLHYIVTCFIMFFGVVTLHIHSLTRKGVCLVHSPCVHDICIFTRAVSTIVCVVDGYFNSVT
jgi:hypothetical protein